MTRHAVIVASRATGYVFEVFTTASAEKAGELSSRLHREGQAANQYFGQDHRITIHEIKPAPRIGAYR